MMSSASVEYASALACLSESRVSPSTDWPEPGWTGSPPYLAHGGQAQRRSTAAVRRWAPAPIFPSQCALLMARGARPRQVGWALAITGLGATILPSVTGFVSTRTASLRAGLAMSMVAALALLILSVLMPQTARQ